MVNFQHILSFITTAETLNLQKSSELLFITPSSISRHISALERELGVPLFIRTKANGISGLTQEGQTLLPYFKKIFGEVESLTKETELLRYSTSKK